MKYGVNVARRAWLEKKDLLNTMSLQELLKALKSRIKAIEAICRRSIPVTILMIERLINQSEEAQLYEN